MTSPSLRPVVAIDYDGVLRIRNDPDFAVEGSFTREVVFREDDYPRLFHGKPRFVDGVSNGTDRFSGVGAAWVRDLIDRGIDVVLATTWQHWANTYFADALGFPELPVAVIDTGDDDWHHCSPAWKSHQLARRFNGRPLLWVDDNEPDRPGESFVEHRAPKDRALTHFQQPLWVTGIEAKDVTEMDAWLALASTPEGQAELRARRRRAKARSAAASRRWRRDFEERKARNHR